MKVQATQQHQIYNYQNISDNLLPYFAWAERWKVKVSGGLLNPVGEFFTDLQEIFGSEPKIKFLRIVEETDENEFFIRDLHIFIDVKGKLNGGRENALKHAIYKAQKRSKEICYRCGCSISETDWGEYHKLIEKFCFDEKISENKFQFMKVCLGCMKNKYSASKLAEIEKLTVEKKVEKAVALDASIVNVKKESDIDIDEIGEIQEEVIDIIIDNSDSENLIALYKVSDVDQLDIDYKGASREQASRVNNLVKKIRGNTHQKRLAIIPNKWKGCCDTLSSSFPNFSEVIEFIRSQLALSSISNQVLKLPPILLVGDAGIGKTEFMLTLANLFDTKLSVIDVANSQSGSALAGSENFWGNTKPGQLFESLVFGEVANPIVMLDEIDKVVANSAYNPLSALHALLEERQAKQFKDLSVPEIQIDASHVVWIATANKLNSIEKPICDRFTTFHIETPSSVQMREIVKNQYTKFIQSSPSGVYFDSSIENDVMDKLCSFHPRGVRKMLERAFGVAAVNNRKKLIVSDIQETKIIEVAEKIGIGFMADI